MHRCAKHQHRLDLGLGGVSSLCKSYKASQSFLQAEYPKEEAVGFGNKNTLFTKWMSFWGKIIVDGNTRNKVYDKTDIKIKMLLFLKWPVACIIKLLWS